MSFSSDIPIRPQAELMTKDELIAKLSLENARLQNEVVEKNGDIVDFKQAINTYKQDIRRLEGTV